MAIQTYKKNDTTKISKYFTPWDFRCGLGRTCGCGTTLVDEQLTKYLDAIGDHFGVTPKITSGYRCPSYNKSVGGATGSRHSKGQAADIVVSGVAPRAVAAYAESLGILGIGLYETAADGHFVHIDTRTTKAFWYGQKQAYRSTFAGSGTTVSGSLLRRGSTGAAVKSLQEKLIRLGYDCGPLGADGDFGAKTEAAVRKFQKDNGLAADGIAGPLTLAKIEELSKAQTGNSQRIRVTASALNVRSGAGTDNAVVGVLPQGAVRTIQEEQKGWGKILAPAGWISLQYTERLG